MNRHSGLASHLAGRGLLRDAVGILAVRGIPVMPLKGIWLQHHVYENPGARRITDVDVLVPERRYEAAVDALRAAGWSLAGSNSTEAALSSPSWPLPLDLHRQLFTRGSFCLSNDALFARGRLDRAVYDCEVVLPDPLDVVAHAVGHFVKSRGGRDTNSHEPRDLPRLLARFALDPARTARHLERCGLARAARYALRCVSSEQDPAGLCAATLASLQNDEVGDRCATAMLRLRDRWGPSSNLAIVPGFVLQPSLTRAVYSLGVRVWDRRSERPSARDGAATTVSTRRSQRRPEADRC